VGVGSGVEVGVAVCPDEDDGMTIAMLRLQRQDATLSFTPKSYAPATLTCVCSVSTSTIVTPRDYRACSVDVEVARLLRGIRPMHSTYHNCCYKTQYHCCVERVWR